MKFTSDLVKITLLLVEITSDLVKITMLLVKITMLLVKSTIGKVAGVPRGPHFVSSTPFATKLTCVTVPSALRWNAAPSPER